MTAVLNLEKYRRRLGQAGHQILVVIVADADGGDGNAAFGQIAAEPAQFGRRAGADIGEAISHSGVQSRQLIAESFEIAPFYKQLYSSDGWGLAEFHFLGARLWRNGVSEILSRWVEAGHCSQADATQIATKVGRQNAIDLYRLDSSS